MFMLQPVLGLRHSTFDEIALPAMLSFLFEEGLDQPRTFFS